MQKILTIVSSVVGGEIFILILKNLIAAPRPAGAVESGFSFPSNHAFLAVVICGLLAYFLYKHFKNKIFPTLAVIISLLIGYSRIYLGVHYWHDVIGGWLIGLAWLLLTIYVYKIWINKKGRANLPQT